MQIRSLPTRARRTWCVAFATLALLLAPAYAPVLADGALTLDTSGCAATAIDFGDVMPAQDYVTKADCAIGFGTDSGDVQLRIYQQDGAGTMFTGIDDYTATSHDWTSDDDLFAACLRSISAVPTTGWGRPGDSACDTHDGDPWNPIPTGGGVAGSLVAEHTTGNYTANLRFGLRTEAGYASGLRNQQFVVEVVQPAPPPPVNTVLPAITGTTTTGQVLTSDTGTWTGASSYAYQWRRCNAAGASCVDIVGQTANTYTLTSTDVDKTIRVVVTATNVSGSTPATSNQTAVIAGIAPTAGTVSISGTPTYNLGLSANLAGGWTAGTPAGSTTYQWERCDGAGSNCANIAGATGSSYTLVAADIDNTVRVKATRSNSCTTGCGSVNATSSVTAVVAGVAPTMGTASSSGQPGLDRAQTASLSGGTTGTPAATVTYQWRRCDEVGGSCVNIAGATASTYTAVAADLGKTLRVVITRTNTCTTGCGAVSATSSQTAVIQVISYVSYNAWSSSAVADVATIQAPMPAFPNTCPAGDVIITVVGGRIDTAAGQYTAPAGWNATPLGTAIQPSAVRITAFWKVATGADAAQTYASPNSRGGFTYSTCWHNVNTTTPLDVASAGAGNGATETVPSVTTANDYRMLFAAWLHNDDNQAFSGFPAAMTRWENMDHRNRYLVGYEPWKPYPTAPTFVTGTRSVTGLAGLDWAGFMVALRPIAPYP